MTKKFETVDEFFENLHNDICEEIKTKGKEIYPDAFFDLFMLGSVFDSIKLGIWKTTSGVNINIKCYHVTHNDADAIGCGLLTSLITHSNPDSNKLKTYYCDTNGA